MYMRQWNAELQKKVSKRSTMKEDESTLSVYLLISLWILLSDIDETKKSGSTFFFSKYAILYVLYLNPALLTGLPHVVGPQHHLHLCGVLKINFKNLNFFNNFNTVITANFKRENSDGKLQNSLSFKDCL